MLRDAGVGDLRTLNEERAPYDALTATTRKLFRELAERGIDYLLVGGMAVLQYVGGRNTRDIDLIIALADLESLPGLTILSHDGDFARADYNGVQVDALLVTNSVFRRVKTDFSSRQVYGDLEIPTATEEGLVILKLFALPSLYREGDVSRIGVYENDVLGLLSTGAVAIDNVFRVLKSHVLPTDLTELQRIITDIQHRLARVRDRPFADGESRSRALS